MIEVSSNSVSILYPDGTSAVFDAAELSSRIAKSCISAGMPDSWIAEDIALSVEFALQTQLLNSGEKSVHASEIDSEREIEDQPAGGQGACRESDRRDACDQGGKMFHAPGDGAGAPFP